MDRDALVAAVQEESGRYETSKDGMILRAVETAVIIAHSMEDFGQDRVSAILPTSVTDKEFDITPPANFRQVDDLKASDVAGLPLGPRIEETDLEDIYNQSGAAKLRYYFQLGGLIHVVSDVSAAYCRLLYYAFPTFAVGTDTTWITVKYPQAIITLAATDVFRKTGDEKKAKSYGDSWKDVHKPYILANNLYAGVAQ